MLKRMICLLLFIMTPVAASAATYHVDSILGGDSGSGTISAPWKTLEKVSSLTLRPGDKVLFRRSRQFRGTLDLHGRGTRSALIIVDAYGTGSKPVILGSSTVDGGTNGAINLRDVSCYLIHNLEIQAPCTSGMIMQGCSRVTIQHCDFTNIRYLPPGTPEGDDGWAINIRPGALDGAYNTISNCTFRKCLKGVIIQSGDTVILQDSYFFDIHDIAALFAGHCVGRTVTNSRIRRCVFDYTNTTGQGWNPVMFGGTNNCYEEYCETKNTPAGQWDHQVYDFDTNCRNSYIQYCYSHDNLGDLMHSYWVGDASANGPCYFRYNVSVNDKTLYNSVKTTYGLQMYNNTFYNFKGNFGRNIVASDLSDTMVRNNIFHMRAGAGVESLPPGSDYNCYVNCTKPAGESHSMEADPQFVNPANFPSGLKTASASPCKADGMGVPDDFPAPFMRTDNLALHCQVTSSGSVEFDGWGESKVVDGTTNTVPNTMGWRGPGSGTQWIALDLGAPHTINRVILHPRNDSGYIGAGFPRNFRIETSQDNSTWSVASVQRDYPRPGDAPQYFSFRSRSARYVRIAMAGQGQDPTALAEIEVLNDSSPVPPAYPPLGNLALSKDVTASSSMEKDGWYKAKLTDGMRDSAPKALGWSTDPSRTNGPTWVKLDLGAVCSIGKVDLYPRNDSGRTGEGFPTDFGIQVSVDNMHWTTVVSKTGYGHPADGLVRSFSFEPRRARWLRITSLAGHMALAEVEVDN